MTHAAVVEGRAAGTAHRARARVTAAVACMPLMLGCAVVWAGMDVSCEDPMFFREAGVNVVFVPAEGTNGALSSQAQEIVLLMQREMLFRLLAYGSIGVERLYDPGSRPCNLTRIHSVLFGDGQRPGALHEGHGAVVISEHLYEDRTGILVQTYLDYGFYRAVDRVSFAVGAGDASQTFVFEASQPPVIFAPRGLAPETIAQLHQDYQTVAVLHAKPDDASPGIPLALVPKVPFAYYVVDAQGPWMRVQSPDGRAGWTRGTVGVGGSTVSRVLPELDAIEGAAGYLLARAPAPGGEGQAHLKTEVTRERLQQLTLQAFARYLGQVSSIESHRTLSTVHMLAGTVRLPQGTVRGDQAMLESVGSEYQQAVALDPYNSDAYQLRALLRLTRASVNGTPPGADLMAVHHDLWRAASISPEELGIVRNLDQLYQLPSARATQFGLAGEEFQKQATSLRELVKAQ